MRNETMYESGADRIVAVFPGDHDERTSAVGFLDDEGEKLLFTVSNPTEIMMMAHRLAMFADEIQTNRAHNTHSVIAQLEALGPGATMGDLAAHQQRLREAGIVTLNPRPDDKAKHDDK